MKGRTHDNVVIPAGGQVNVDLLVTEVDRIGFLGQFFSVATGADLVLELRAYDDKDQLFNLALSGYFGQQTIVAPDVLVREGVELWGIDRIQVRVKNTLAVAKNATVIYFGERD